MKKILVIFALVLTVFFSGFGLPGFTELIPTENGEYVYYRDYSFKDETYIGFVYYDDETLGVRYFSMGKSSLKSPEVEVVFSLDKAKDSMELTGEKILTEVTNNDVDTVNYIHDLVYELSARRKKAEGRDFSKQFSVSEAYPQFGGNVNIVYDYTIPVFNIESISAIDGNILFQAVTMGILTDSADMSFSTFTGFGALPEKEELKTGKLSRKEKKALEKDIEKLNPLWQKVEGMPGDFKTLGDYAILWTFPLDVAYEDSGIVEDEKTGKSQAENQVFTFFGKSNKFSSSGTYVYLPFSSVKNTGGKQITKMLIYTPDAKTKYSVSYKIVTKNDDKYNMTVFTAYENWFKDHKNYSDYIVNSIK